jgi:putative FmdB family regulatory protein
MPTYVYECRRCGHLFEKFQSIKAAALKRCPRCRGALRRLPGGGAGLLFKGSGFHITDYRSKGYREKAKQEGGGKPAGEGKEKGKGKDPAPSSSP